MWPKDNPESWVRIREILNVVSDPDWKRIAKSTIAALQLRGLNQSFRIGSSMHIIMLSTKPSHHLTGEPHVSLQIDSRKRTIRVTYGTKNIAFGEPETEQTCTIESAVPVILAYLQRLWAETKTEPPPEGLRS